MSLKVTIEGQGSFEVAKECVKKVVYKTDIPLDSNARTKDVEHAVLNYSAGSWYVEDLNSKNGVSVQKGDKRKYKLAPGHPCLLARGDILYIGLVRLMIR